MPSAAPFGLPRAPPRCTPRTPLGARVIIYGLDEHVLSQSELVSAAFDLRLLHKQFRDDSVDADDWVMPVGIKSGGDLGAARSLCLASGGSAVVVVVLQSTLEDYIEFDVNALPWEMAEYITIDASGPTDKTFKNLQSSLLAVLDDDDDDGGGGSGGSGGGDGEKKNASAGLARPPSPQVLLDDHIPSSSQADLLAALERRDGDEQFGEISIPAVLSVALGRRGFAAPTAIQERAFRVLSRQPMTSAIVHAATGSGKTIAFLLPLLSTMLRRPGSLVSAPKGALVIALPTQELAFQTYREVEALLPGATDASSTSPLAQLIESSTSTSNRKAMRRGPSAWKSNGAPTKVEAPIVVGTAKQLSLVFKEVACGDGVVPQHLVMDEVDRLLRVPSKYAPGREKRVRRVHPRPALRLLELIMAINPKLQLVGCSATVGRDLRRQLGFVLQPGNVKGALEVIHATESAATAGDRRVVIPKSISHSYVPCRSGDFRTKVEVIILSWRPPPLLDTTLLTLHPLPPSVFFCFPFFLLPSPPP